VIYYSHRGKTLREEGAPTIFECWGEAARGSHLTGGNKGIPRGGGGFEKRGKIADEWRAISLYNNTTLQNRSSGSKGSQRGGGLEKKKKRKSIIPLRSGEGKQQ